MSVLAVNWTGILAVVALVVAVVSIVIAGLCVYGLVQVRRQTKAQQAKVTDDTNGDSR